MKLDKELKFLIVGLGLMGGSYAKGLKQQGYHVEAIDNNPESIAFALENGIIDKGAATPEKELLGNADVIVLALYPDIVVSWVMEHQADFKSGVIITDVTGIKSCIVYDIQAGLRKDAEFIAAHPMAGREVYGVQNCTEKMFEGANYIIVPTDSNSVEAIEVCKAIGTTLGFARISSLPPKAHDEMIGFVSQLTHCIAVCLMTCSKSEHLVDYTGDSFRDLTRIARINEEMWSRLFSMNKDALLEQMKKFMDEFQNFYEIIENDDIEGMKEKMRQSTARRALFDKKKKED